MNPRIDLNYKKGLLSIIGNKYSFDKYDEDLIPSRIYPLKSYYDEYNHLLILKLYDPIIYSNLIFGITSINTKENTVTLMIEGTELYSNLFYNNKIDEIVHILSENIYIYLYNFIGDPILADISNYHIKKYQIPYYDFSISIDIKIKNDLKNIKRVEMIINPDPIIKTI